MSVLRLSPKGLCTRHTAKILYGATLVSAAFIALLSYASVSLGDASAQTLMQNDAAVLRTRLAAEYVTADAHNAVQFLGSQRPDGSWADVNYSDQSNAWEPHKHLDRLQQMAIAYANARNPEYRSSAMLQGTIQGLSFWFAKQPLSENWWWNEIGQQLALERIYILLQDELSPTLIDAAIKALDHPKRIRPGPDMATGQNLIWFTAEELISGILRASDKDIASASQLIQGMDIIRTDEGIQPDYSFHQHGPQLYMGGYGLQFVRDESEFARLVSGTRFAFSPDKIDVLEKYLYTGARYFVRGTMLDYGAMGREISRQGGRAEAPGLIPACINLAVVKPDTKLSCDALIASIEGKSIAPSFVGHKHFWMSDFSVHQRAAYYTSVKMASTRTYGTESLNGENIKGYWIPFGTNYIVRRGDEYRDLFPVLDWAHLPGVTSPDVTPPMRGYVSQHNNFVGGVSDGTYGASAMKLDLEAEAPIHAYKSWFFFDDEYVALGAGITSPSSRPVSTTLNQTLLQGTVIVDGKPASAGRQNMNNVSWILHDDIGYVFPTKTPVILQTGRREGQWSSINLLESKDSVTQDVFALWVDHGLAPNNQQYAYIVVPGTDAQEISHYSRYIPVHIISNTTSVQAVSHGRLGLIEAVFFAPARLVVSNVLTISVDRPCMLMLQAQHGPTTLTVSNPSGAARIIVSISTPKGDTLIPFELPGGSDAGRSQLKTLTSP